MKKYMPGEESVVMTRDQVRAFDLWCIDTVGMAGVILMENAGRSCAELIKSKLCDTENGKVCIFCGPGNNGGDGFVIARHLFNSNFDVTVVIVGDMSKIKGDAKVNLDIVQTLKLRVEQVDISQPDLSVKIKNYVCKADIVVDGLFGTGLRGELGSDYKRLIKTINVQNRPVLSVDIPSGLDCDTGQPLSEAIKAAWTVTFAAVKTGFTLSQDIKNYTGEVYIASIGVEPSAYLRS